MNNEEDLLRFDDSPTDPSQIKESDDKLASGLEFQENLLHDSREYNPFASRIQQDPLVQRGHLQIPTVSSDQQETGIHTSDIINSSSEFDKLQIGSNPVSPLKASYPLESKHNQETANLKYSRLV